MYPTLFKIPYLPDWLADVKSYGVMMMIAFLSGIWLAVRRAMRSQADPDMVLNLGFISLIFGVAGARAMFVIHYWETRFANTPNPIAAIFDVRAGGLEFWGGPLAVIPAIMIYLKLKKVSVRWYLDICIPSLAWGLAITRIGCFLNGCCWGAVCIDPKDPARDKPAVPWAVQFPYGSAAMQQQYRFGQLTIPKELIHTYGSGESMPLAREWIDAAAENDGQEYKKLEAAKDAALAELRRQTETGADAATLSALNRKAEQAGRDLQAHISGTQLGVVGARCREYGMTPTQLQQLASHFPSKPVHPAQLYAVINAFLLSWVLSTIFYVRRHHGIVLGWFLVLYSFSRVLEEAIRQDNPLDQLGGLTISQMISIITFLSGVIWLVVVRRMPPMSPLAVPFVPPEEDGVMPKPDGPGKRG